MNLKIHRKDNQLMRIVREQETKGYFNWGDGQFRLTGVIKDVPYVYIEAKEIWR